MANWMETRHDANCRCQYLKIQVQYKLLLASYLFIIGDMSQNILHLTGKDVAEVVKGRRGDVAVVLERIQRTTAKGIVLNERVCADSLSPHGLPQRIVGNHRNHLAVIPIIFCGLALEYSRYIGYYMKC